MSDYDPGPPPALADHFAALPSFEEHRDLFWFDWGPVFYRGRLDGSARLLAIASDPGPTERVACRTLVGDAGQRVQGFLTRLGLTHDYVLVNAFPLALHPSRSSAARPLLAHEPYRGWLNALLDQVSGPAVEAVVAFGTNARAALRVWDHAPDVPTFTVSHPSNHSTADLLDSWREALPAIRAAVAVDPGGDNTGSNYGSTFEETDYAPIPARDLPFGLPDWVGDDHWGRTARPRHNNSVDRPASDPDHALVWRAPDTAPEGPL